MTQPRQSLQPSQPRQSGAPTAIESARILAGLGLVVQWLCSETCPGHGVPVHPPDKAGKVPLARDWTHLPWRCPDALELEHRPGNNPSVITGWREDGTRRVVVDTDDAEQEAWCSAHLPPTPWMVQTRRGWHRYYDHPGKGVHVRSTIRTSEGRKVCDVKGEGGQVVAMGGVVAGHVYTPTRRWLASDALPVFDPAWFDDAAGLVGTGLSGMGLVGAGLPSGAMSGHSASSARRFTSAEGLEAFERAVEYAQADLTPVSISGKGGDDAVYEIALKIRRGFPLIPILALPSQEESVVLASSVPTDAPTYAIDPTEADEVALWILEEHWNTRCVDSDGKLYPWPTERLRYKVGQAARAHLYGKPDFWLFDDVKYRKRYASARAGWAESGQDAGSTPLSATTPARTAATVAVSTVKPRRALGRQTTDVWESPIPLDETPPMPFPDGVFRGHLADYVSAVTASVQTPYDMAAMMALAMLSVVARGKLIVQVRPDYREQVCLFITVGAESGERKSALRLLSRPIDEWEAATIKASQPLLVKHSSIMAGIKGRLESLQRRLTKSMNGGDGDGEAESQEDIVELIRLASEEQCAAEAAAPPSGRVTTEDITPEALADVMLKAGGNISLVSDEGGDVFRMMAGKYDDHPLLNVYLKGHTGDQFKRDRRNGGTTVIPRASMSIGVLTQPDTFRTLTSRELQERGLVARFLFSIPASRVGYRMDTDPPPIPSLIKRQYSDLISRMLRISVPPANGPIPNAHILELAPGADDAYRELHNDIETRVRDGGDLRQMRAWGNKLVGHIIRIAALLHMADWAVQPSFNQRMIQGETFRRAMLLTEYLISHARRAFGVMSETGEVAAARKALVWIRKQEARNFTTRELHRGVNRNGKFCDVAEPALRVLEDHGYVRLAPKSVKGGRPTERYEVHPEVFK